MTLDQAKLEQEALNSGTNEIFKIACHPLVGKFLIPKLETYIEKEPGIKTQ